MDSRLRGDPSTVLFGQRERPHRAGRRPRRRERNIGERRPPTRCSAVVAKADGVLVSNGINGDLFGSTPRRARSCGASGWPDMTLSSPLVALRGWSLPAPTMARSMRSRRAAEPRPGFDRYVYSFTNRAGDPGFFWFKPDMIEAIGGGLASAGFTNIGNEELSRRSPAPVTTRAARSSCSRIRASRAGWSRRSADSSMAAESSRCSVPIRWSTALIRAARPVTSTRTRKKPRSGSNARQGARQRLQCLGVHPRRRAARTPRINRAQRVDRGRTKSRPFSASDRSGMATAWIKKFANGGLLIDLPLPRNRTPDLSPYVNAIDLAVARSSTGCSDRQLGRC